MQGRLIPLPQIAKASGFALRRLQRWCESGRLRGVKWGGRWYVRMEDLEAMRGG